MEWDTARGGYRISMRGPVVHCQQRVQDFSEGVGHCHGRRQDFSGGVGHCQGWIQDFSEGVGQYQMRIQDFRAVVVRFLGSLKSLIVRNSPKG